MSCRDFGRWRWLLGDSSYLKRVSVRMHICFAVSAMYCGGAERVVSTLSAEFARRGHLVDIVMVSMSSTDCYYELDSRVRLHPLCEGHRGRVNPLQRTRLLKKLILDIAPDVVISFLPHVCIYTWLAMRSTKIPYILSERNDPNTYSFLMKALLRIAFEDADACVFQTHDAIKWYRGAPKETDRVIFNPVGLTFVPEVGLPKERKNNVLFVGRFDEQKNYMLLLDSFRQLVANHADLVLDIYGDGPDRDVMTEVVDRYGIQDKVIFHGRSNTWHFEQFDAGVYLSTSNYEGMSNSLEEAAALGIPCVATDCPIGGSKELASVFDNISLVPMNDVAALCKGVEDSLLSSRAFEGIDGHVSREWIAGQWLDLAAAILNLDMKNTGSSSCLDALE